MNLGHKSIIGEIERIVHLKYQNMLSVTNDLGLRGRAEDVILFVCRQLRLGKTLESCLSS